MNLLFSFASVVDGLKQTWNESLSAKILFIAIPVILVLLIVLIATKKKVDEKLAEENVKQEVATKNDIKSNSLFEVVKPEEEIKEKPVKVVKPVPVKTTPVVAVKEQPKPVVKKPVPKKVETPVPVKEEKKTEKKFVGKWIIESKSETEFMAVLMANNGEVMLTTETYTSVEGTKSGIKTIIKAIATGEFVIYQDKSNDYYYKLKTAYNRFLCAGEIYKTKDRCLKSVETVKRIAKEAVIVDKVFEGSKYVDYTPVKNPTYNVKKGFEGKWKVETDAEGKFSSKLYASNGQLMFATEYVSTRNGAIKAIESIKKNSAEGNFVIDKDKFGRFYYKLRNSQRMVICMGEAYDNLTDCTNALESMRKFASTAIFVEE